ncbi:MAG: DUF1009 domain-containing protein [Rhizobiales bacterium]|nr:DUF1009 domain-containing protein [Hyphomicrobiales bacterium]
MGAEAAGEGAGAPAAVIARSGAPGHVGGKAHPLAIIAGSGELPLMVAALVRERGRALHIVGLRGLADPGIEAYPHTWAGLGEFGRVMRAMRGAGARDLVIIGGARRPDLASVRFDLGGLMALPLILGLTRGGDDKLLGRIIRFFESRGLRVVGAHEVAPELLAGLGVLGRHRPTRGDLADIAKARDVVASLARHDIGQAAVVARGHVLAVEAAEGTDRMLERCVGLQQWGRGRSGVRVGVLFKGPKAGQDLRVDMPAVGPNTVILASKAGLAGIAIMGESVLVADREATIRAADEAGLFLVGLAHETQAATMAHVDDEGAGDAGA